MLVAKAHKYFIFFFILNPLFIQFSLTVFLSFPLGFRRSWSFQKYLNPWKWLQRNRNGKVVCDRRIHGAALSPIHLRSTETPEAPNSREPETKTCGFFLGHCLVSLSLALSLSLFSLTGCHGRTSHGQSLSKSFHCNSISLSRRWIVVNWWGLILVSGFVDWFICGFVMEHGLWIVAYELWIWFCCFNVVEGGWRVVVADENGLDWFRLPFGCFREYNKK